MSDPLSYKAHKIIFGSIHIHVQSHVEINDDKMIAYRYSTQDIAFRIDCTENECERVPFVIDEFMNGFISPSQNIESASMPRLEYTT